jgi:hypothetical protein
VHDIRYNLGTYAELVELHGGVEIQSGWCCIFSNILWSQECQSLSFIGHGERSGTHRRALLTGVDVRMAYALEDSINVIGIVAIAFPAI